MIYLDNAATTWPKPHSVRREVIRCLDEYGGNPGRGGHKLALKAASVVYDCRCAICEIFGGRPENVVFCGGATSALNLAIKCFAARFDGGGHILMSPIEHNSVRRPVASLKKRGWEYSVFSLPTEPCHPRTVTAAAENALRDDTKIMVVCHASNICGIRLPLYELGCLCRERGILLVVDGAQSGGLYDIDIDKCNISALCCPGHKSLYGIQGVGFALFSDECADADFWGDITYNEGGSGLLSTDENMPPELPERFEAGTLSLPAIAALNAGIAFVKRNKSEIREREAHIIRRLKYMLMNTKGITVHAPHFDDTPILLFSSNTMPPSELAAVLDDRDICTRAGLHCAPLAHRLLGTPEDGAVRVSVGAFNSTSDAEAVWKAIVR